jgi:hypothetical protein
MYKSLVPCPRCQRHVRTDEPACPFCAAVLPSDLDAHAIPAAPQRLSRAAAFVFGASLTVAGCGSEVSTGSGSGGGSEPTGTASGNSSAATGGMTDGGPNDDGGGMALYGDPPPIDAGPVDDGGTPPLDAGPFDAGPADDGGWQGLYGAAPHHEKPNM